MNFSLAGLPGRVRACMAPQCSTLHIIVAPSQATGDAPYECFAQSWRVALRMCRQLLTTFRALNGAVDQAVAFCTGRP